MENMSIQREMDPDQEPASIPPEPTATLQPEEPTTEIPPAPPRLAFAPDILALFLVMLKCLGVVGEERGAKVLFLALVSRLLPSPVSIVVKGPSSCGKSNLVNKVLAFFPPTAYYALSAMSERALAYSTEPLSHRMLVVYEAAGLTGDMATYLMRSLLSEGRIDYETVIKTKDGLKAVPISREGPTGLISTTTALNLHPENETRFFSLPIIDTAAQTRAVMRAMVEETDEDESVDLDEWHQLQNWLEGAERRVTIPYRHALANLVDATAPRVRRDFKRVLSLVQAHAILHQSTRKKDNKGRIVAELTDYEAVYKIVADLAAEAVQAAIPSTVRETVEATRAVLDRKGEDDSEAVQVTATKKEIADELGLHKTAGGRRVDRAISLGFLRDLTSEAGKHGVETQIIVGSDMPNDREVLPSPARIRAGCTVAEVAEG